MVVNENYFKYNKISCTLAGQRICLLLVAGKRSQLAKFCSAIFWTAITKSRHDMDFFIVFGLRCFLPKPFPVDYH